MADEATDDRVEMKAKGDRSIIPGAAVVALGLLVLAVALVEYLVFADIAGSRDAGKDLFGLSFATIAYLASYTAAGVVLIAVGIRRIYRAR